MSFIMERRSRVLVRGRIPFMGVTLVPCLLDGVKQLSLSRRKELTLSMASIRERRRLVVSTSLQSPMCRI